MFDPRSISCTQSPTACFINKGEQRTPLSYRIPTVNFMPQYEASVMVRWSPSMSSSLAISNNTPGVALVLLALSALMWECEGFVVRPPPGTPVYRGTGISGDDAAEEYRTGRCGFWSTSSRRDRPTTVSGSSRRERNLDADMGASSGVDMAFDLTSDIGARMGLFVDGE